MLIAAGLPVESYLPNGDRESFENGGAIVRPHAAFHPSMQDAATVLDTSACAPLMIVGSAVDAVRQRLMRRGNTPRRMRALTGG